MCRRRQLRGCLMLGIGIGLLVGQCLESWFLSVVGGCALVILGILALLGKSQA